ncbi:MAG: rod shape-determining protein RodA [Bacillota bacterium]|nr:rod shape-determining protein RodA [Bacillota bacterium]
MFDRKLIRSLDWSLYGAYLFISLFGLLMIASASANNEFGDPLHYVRRQIMFMAIGHVLLIISLVIDYQFFANLSIPIYLVNLGLLAAVLVLGVKAGGAQRWINIGGFTLQPSEFAKVAVIVTLASAMEKLGKMDSIPKLIVVGIHVAIPMGLIVIQPDLGTSLVFVGILIAMLYAAGITRSLMAMMFVAGVSLAPVIWLNGLKAYQRTRLLVFLNPGSDLAGVGYHLQQSIIAVGSGLLTGRGLFNGPQSQLNFLPEQHTDFIFSVVGEELGFLGATLLIFALFFVIYRCLQASSVAKDAFGRYLAVGAATWIAFQTIVNTGMTAGIMPVTGLPLPFVSAGGSSYMALSIAIGLVLNVGMRHRKILF